MDFSELKHELAERGNADLTHTRMGRYINAARAELDRMYLWPWRENSAEGTAPMIVTDLARVEAVINQSQSDQRLRPAQYKDLLDAYGDLTTAGTPMYYYISRPLSDPVIATYPTSDTDTIGVQYWKVTADLVNSTDEPESPAEAHYLIVDLAVRRASRDIRDHQGAEAIQSEIDRQLDALWNQYMPGIPDETSVYVVSTNPYWP